MMYWAIVLGIFALILKAKGAFASTGSVAMATTGFDSLARLVGFDTSRLRFPGDNEEQKILQVGANTGVDPRLLAAIRLQENGSPGRQYGILGVNAPTLEDQLQISANTVRNTLTRFTNDTGMSPVGTDGRYTPDFITYLGSGGPSYKGYAAPGAPNDPTGLNDYWIGNVMDNYYSTEIVS